jgi:hypothetical protein
VTQKKNRVDPSGAGAAAAALRTTSPVAEEPAAAEVRRKVQQLSHGSESTSRNYSTSCSGSEEDGGAAAGAVGAAAGTASEQTGPDAATLKRKALDRSQSSFAQEEGQEGVKRAKDTPSVSGAAGLGLVVCTSRGEQRCGASLWMVGRDCAIVRSCNLQSTGPQLLELDLLSFVKTARHVAYASHHTTDP